MAMTPPRILCSMLMSCVMPGNVFTARAADDEVVPPAPSTPMAQPKVDLGPKSVLSTPPAPKEAAPKAIPSMADYPVSPEYRISSLPSYDPTMASSCGCSQCLKCVDRTDGTITLRLIGQIHAAGQTIDQLREVLEKKYVEFYPEPSIDVTPVNTGSAARQVREAISGVGGFTSQQVQ